MESVITTINKYLGSALGNKATGPKMGGVASIGVGLLAGVLTGDWMIAGLGIGIGLFAAPFLNNVISAATAETPASKAIPRRIDPTAQPDATEKVQMTVGGVESQINLPNINALKRPWGSEGSNGYVAKMAEDTRRLVESPESKEQSVDTLLVTLEERNQPFYDYLGIVVQFETDYKKYHDEVRPQWIKQLHLDDSKVLASMAAPPAFTEKLDLKLSDYMVADTKTGLGISNEDWNKFDNVKRLSRMEEYANKRMVEISTKYAKLRSEMEGQYRKVPRDLSFAAFKDTMNWASFEIFGKTAETQMSEAASEFMNDNTGTKEAEDRFRAKMESAITQVVSKGVFGGETAAEQARELTSMLIDEHKVNLQFNSVRSTKQLFASQAEAWVKKAAALRSQITGYAAQYANGAAASQSFVLVQQASIPLIVNNDAKKRSAELQQEQKASYNAILKAKEGALALLTKLNMTDEKVAFEATPLLDMEGDIKALPASWDIRRTGADSKDLLLRDDLEFHAKRYNDAVTKYRGDKSLDNKSMLSVVRKSLANASATYAEQAYHWYESAKKTRDKEMQDVAKKTNTGTALDGVEGIRFFVVDKRPGKNQKFALDGVKKDGKVTITGWSRLSTDEKLGQRRWLGANMLDTDNGVDFDPVTMQGMDKIIEKTEAAPQSAPERASVTTAANENFFDQALKAVGFKAVTDSGSYMLPGVRTMAGVARVA